MSLFITKEKKKKEKKRKEPTSTGTNVYMSRDRCPCVCVCLWCLRIVSVRVHLGRSSPGPWTMPLTTNYLLTTNREQPTPPTSPTYHNNNNNGTVVEREWTSSGYGDGGAPGRTAEPSCSEPLLPTGEQSQCKGTSGQQLENPRGRLEIPREPRGRGLARRCPQLRFEASDRREAMVEHERARLR